MKCDERSKWLVVPAAAALLAIAACGGGHKVNDILPTTTSFCATPPATDPVVFLQKNPADTTDSDNLVLVDVMLRHTLGVGFRGITLELTFTPGVVQVGQIDASATPLGDCGGSGLCPPICANNVTSNTSPANTTGDLLIGVAAQQCTATANVTGTERLLTITFIGSSVGTSPITLVDGAGHGDCEILDSNGDPLPITCDAGTCGGGEAAITVTR